MADKKGKENAEKREQPHVHEHNHKLDERRLQQMYLQFQMLKQQMDEGVQNKMMLDQKMGEIINTRNIINEMKKAKKDTEIWSPIGSDAYAPAMLKDTTKFAIAVGAGVVVKRNAAEALEIISKKEKEMQELDRQVVSHVNQIQTQMQILEQAMSDAVANHDAEKRNKNEDAE